MRIQWISENNRGDPPLVHSSVSPEVFDGTPRTLRDIVDHHMDQLPGALQRSQERQKNIVTFANEIDRLLSDHNTDRTPIDLAVLQGHVRRINDMLLDRRVSLSTLRIHCRLFVGGAWPMWVRPGSGTDSREMHLVFYHEHGGRPRHVAIVDSA